MPVGRLSSDHSAGQPAFCCQGCETVHALLGETGLTAYYRVRERAGADARAAAPSFAGYEELDDPAWQRLYVEALADGRHRAELVLGGVHCSACLWLVERSPRVAPGLDEARLDLNRSVVTLTWWPEQIRLSQVARALDRLGYPVHPHRGARRREAQRLEERALLARMAVAGAAAMNVMLMAFGLYGGAFSGMEHVHREFLRWGSLILAVPAILWTGATFFRGARAALLTRTPHIDLPVAVGLSAGLLGGVVNTVRGAGEIYFDSLTVLVFLLLVGRWLSLAHRRAAADAAELVHALAPSRARLVEGDTTRVVPIEAIARGAVVEVAPGETVPADGEVVAGRSSVDASLLTGEPRPEAVAPGARVHAGVVNLSGVLRIAVAETGAATRVGRLMEGIAASAARRAPTVRAVDRVAAWFVVGVLGLALLTVLLWVGRSPTLAVEHAVALLVVTCPCALGMATPLAVTAALGKAARAGILIKGGDALERLAQPALIVFDKTGTLTGGRLRLVEFHGDASARALLRALEAHSVHPVAHALRRDLGAFDGGTLPVVEGLEERLGAGVAGRLGAEAVRAGAPRALEDIPCDPQGLRDRAAALAARGYTPVLVARGDTLVGLAGLGDPPRPDTAAALVALTRQGHRLALLSGDHPAAVAALARTLEEQAGAALFAWVEGGASPERKLARIEAELRTAATPPRADSSPPGERPVVMVGDGVNDAAALARATVGVAVHGGAEASLAAADVFLQRPGVGPVVELIEGARRTVRTIHRGLAFSLVYNAVGAGLAMVGLLGPILAAILMPVSSLTVVTHAFRARSFRPSGQEPVAPLAAGPAQDAEWASPQSTEVFP